MFFKKKKNTRPDFQDHLERNCFYGALSYARQVSDEKQKNFLKSKAHSIFWERMHAGKWSSSEHNARMWGVDTIVPCMNSAIEHASKGICHTQQGSYSLYARLKSFGKTVADISNCNETRVAIENSAEIERDGYSRSILMMLHAYKGEQAAVMKYYNGSEEKTAETEAAMMRVKMMGVIPGDPEPHMAFASEAGHPDGLFVMGVHLLNKNDTFRGENMLRDAAKKEHPDAGAVLADFLSLHAPERKEEINALYRHSAERGNKAAEAILYIRAMMGHIHDIPVHLAISKIQELASQGVEAARLFILDMNKMANLVSA